jgi:hypothetical protein
MSVVTKRALFILTTIPLVVMLTVWAESIEPFTLSAVVNAVLGVVAGLLWWRYYPMNDHLEFVPTHASERPALIGLFIVPLIVLAITLIIFAYVQQESGAIFIGAGLLTCYIVWARSVAFDKG